LGIKTEMMSKAPRFYSSEASMSG